MRCTPMPTELVYLFEKESETFKLNQNYTIKKLQVGCKSVVLIGGSTICWIWSIGLGLMTKRNQQYLGTLWGLNCTQLVLKGPKCVKIISTTLLYRQNPSESLIFSLFQTVFCKPDEWLCEKANYLSAYQPIWYQQVCHTQKSFKNCFFPILMISLSVIESSSPLLKA